MLKKNKIKGKMTVNIQKLETLRMLLVLIQEGIKYGNLTFQSILLTETDMYLLNKPFKSLSH